MIFILGYYRFIYEITNIIGFAEKPCVPRAEDEAFAGPNCPLFGGIVDLFTGADLI